MAPIGPWGLVLAYHLVGGGTQSRVDLPTEAFPRQVEQLRAEADLVGLGSFAEAFRQRGRRPRPLVALTFDDAYENFARWAWPVLEEARVPATLFLPVGFLEGEASPPLRGADLPPVSWQSLREMLATDLLTVGSHSWTHRDLRQLTEHELEREVVGSKERIEERLGVPVESFCYPRALWNRRVERVVRRTYPLVVVGGGRRVAARSFRPYRIPRVSVTRSMTDLRPVLASRVWLPELLGDLWRRYVRRRAAA